MVDAYQNLNGSRDLTTPHSGIVCHHSANTFTISLLLPNLKSLSPTNTKVWKMIQVVEDGVVWG